MNMYYFISVPLIPFLWLRYTFLQPAVALLFYMLLVPLLLLFYDIAMPLTCPSEKGRNFSWDDDRQKRFKYGRSSLMKWWSNSTALSKNSTQK